jgi:putative aminopeptidase FrvX
MSKPFSSPIPRALGLISASAFLAASPALAQTSAADLAARLSAMSAVTGYEQRMVDTMLTLLPGAKRDRAGDAVLVLGSGEPRRLIACPLDEPGYAVGGLRDDGYLTLRRLPGHNIPPLFDQQLEGQRVTVFGRLGAVPGVVAVRSTHLTRGRSGGSDDPFTVDGAYVDVGASSRADLARLGVTVLSPVTLAKRPHRYGRDLLAAPVAGRRSACAALLAAARARQVKGTVVIALVVEQNLYRRGILTVANVGGPVDQVVLLTARAGELGTIGTEAETDPVPNARESVRWLLPVRFADSPVETVSLGDVAKLQQRVEQWMGGGE